MTLRTSLGLSLLTLAAVGCSDDTPLAGGPPADAGTLDAGPRVDETLACTNAKKGVVKGAPLALAGMTGSEIAPSPPSIGADIPVTYFGPPPSAVNPRLIGPVQLLKSGTVDLEKLTIQLPLYRAKVADPGAPSGFRTSWYIVTDTSDKANAASLGVNFSSKLVYAESVNTLAVRPARYEADGTLTIDRGLVDFTPVRNVVPGAAPNFFPPVTAVAGGSGDAAYSPLVRIENAGGHIYDAPIVGNGEAADLDFCTAAPDKTRVHDKVVRFCPKDRTVTLELTPGFSFGRPVLYLSTEASGELPAALEGGTTAPGLASVTVGRDDSLFSAVERIFVFTNGPMGKDNPQRQGLNSALADGRPALNVVGGIPTIATDYSPLWDMNLGEWTADAIAKGYRSRLIEEFQILGFAKKGFLTGPKGAPYGSVGFIINCPIVQRLL